ncbi:MAG: amidohydrolase family protein [Bdellovibrionaceae bacterium]|nr:amidohydrolase family protein [Pseudobdellovibrionaceae bacterium]
MLNSMRKYLGLLVFAITFVSFFTFFHFTHRAGRLDLGSQQSVQKSTGEWTLSGYLPENPTKKVWLTIRGGLIANISEKAPTHGPIVETETLIFPGLIDMHNHIKYNVLPLWDLAQSQFINRFEWRKRFPPYKDAVSFNMKAFSGDAICAAVRWAELKALAGGTTLIQGIGNDSKCAVGFGTMNVEISSDLGIQTRIRAMTDIVIPDLMGKVYFPHLKPINSTERAQSGKNADQITAEYEAALLTLLQKKGFISWMHKLLNEPKTLGNALLLTIGENFGLENGTVADFDKLIPQISHVLKNKYSVNERDIPKQVEAIRTWIFGKRNDGYLQIKPLTSPLTAVALVKNPIALDFVAKSGVFTLDRHIRRYLGMFEGPIRQSALRYLSSSEAQAIVAHLSEGTRKDAYNSIEYTLFRDVGLARPGMVLIHGVGMDEAQLQHAARSGISLVWSPFSNLLLYGETLDVVAARKQGINIALGPDWSPTGSKNILDELKIARRYLRAAKIPESQVSDKDLVQMATINAAKALRLEKRLGQVAPGFVANLLLVRRQAELNPWTTLVRSEQKDVQLVVVGGEPLYGQENLMLNYRKATGDNTLYEVINLSGSCGFRPIFRNPRMTALDVELAKENKPEIRSYEQIKSQLNRAIEAFHRQVRDTMPKMADNLVGLDPAFNCEDSRYSNIFSGYVENLLPEYIRKRSEVRVRYKLDAKWNPMNSTDDEEDLPQE